MSLTVFVSYSHHDEDLRAELVKQLANLQRQGRLQAWYDRVIEAGTDWNHEIERQLRSAQVILLLISPDFIASNFCYEREMQLALERHQQNQACVVPVLLRPTDWDGAPFSHLQVLPQDGWPVTLWENQDLAFFNVVQGIRRVVAALSMATVAGASTGDGASGGGKRRGGRSLTPAVYHQRTWVERSQITPTLLEILHSSCRILTLTGMTGIGKTALAERLVAELEDDRQWRRFNLDDGGVTPDFVTSGAAFLRALGEEPTLEDQKDPHNLLDHILEVLRSHPYRVQIDSLERLLRGNDEEGWSEFCDRLWLDLFQQVLAGNACASQLLVTTQDVPGELEAIGARYPQYSHCEGLPGLNQTEQLELFRRVGVEAESNYLQRIGTLYEGHPLILSVIAEDIKACGGNVTRYWQQCRFADLEAQHPVKLSRRRLQREVKQRVKQSLERLPADAYQLLCRSAVYRRPVPETFWLAMLPGCPEEQQQAALSLLISRGLAVEDWEPEQWLGADGAVPLRQHNLIRSVAYEHLKTNSSTWQRAELSAVDQWLTHYEPAADVPNLETIRGCLEAFHHYCEVKNWDNAKTILLDQEMGLQLQTWGHYQEMIALHNRLTGCLSQANEVSVQRGIGTAYYCLSNYPKTIHHWQQSLELACELCDRQAQWKALNNLGMVHRVQGDYPRASEYLEQALKIARELGDRQGEGNALGNLGIAYDSLGKYQRAISFHQQALVISQEIGDRRGEGSILGNLGIAYSNLGEYQQAIDFYQQHLAIARDIGDRRGEATVLGNLGCIYEALKDYKKAFEYHHQSLNIEQEIGNRHGEGESFTSLGATLTFLEKYSESQRYLQLALKISKEINNKPGEAEVLKALADLHHKIDRLTQARDYCDAALQLATDLGIPLVAECLQLKAKLDANGGSV